jgi:hypothetical protein
MDYTDNLHRMIFNTGCSDTESPENAILKSVLDKASDNLDKLLAAVQIYEYGTYLKTKISKLQPQAHGLSFIVSAKINCMVLSIIKHIDDTYHTDITMHRDEYALIERMFKSVIGYYESMEQFEKCFILTKARDSFQSRTKIC